MNEAQQSSEDVERIEGPSVRKVSLITAIAVGALMLGFLVVLATRPSGERTARSQLINKVAPKLSGASLLAGGAPFDLADQRGRYVVVNFFATWCPPCIEEHPELVAFATAHAAARDASVVSVVFNDDNNDVRSFFAKRGGDWPVLDDARAAVDFGVLKVPESFVVNPSGVVIAKFNGGVTQARIERALTQDQARTG